MHSVMLGWVQRIDWGQDILDPFEGKWSPVTDANQAIQLAEVVRTKASTDHRLSLWCASWPCGSIARYDVTFEVGVESRVALCDASFSRALTLASLSACGSISAVR